MSKVFTIGGHPVGGGAPVFVIAEIGANHDGSFERALALVEMAARSGASAVKFQSYTAAELVADGDREVEWGRLTRRREKIGALFDRLAVPDVWLTRLVSHAHSLGMAAFTTPFAPERVPSLVKTGIDAIKVASSDVSYPRLLQAAASSGLPVLLSLGKSTLEECDLAVACLRANGCSDYALLHCVASYPAPIEEMNLRLIPFLADRYGELPVGLSDHSQGATVAVAAVALGAAILEKHVTLNRESEGPDHWFSADEEEFRSIVQQVAMCRKALGRPEKTIVPSEHHERKVSTRSLIVRIPLRCGDVISDDMLDARRPGWGISPWRQAEVVGRRVTRDLAAGQVIEWGDLGEKPGG